MRKTDAEFQQRIRAAFLGEARGHLQAIATGLLALERRAPDTDPDLVEVVFRHTHSLKGAARVAGFHRIEHLCQSLESVLARCREGGLTLDASHFDLLHQAFDLTGELVDLPEGSAEINARSAAVVQKLAAIAPATATGPSSPAPSQEPRIGSEEERPDREPAPAVARETHTKVPAAELDRLLRSAEEMLTLKHSSQERTRQFMAVGQEFAVWQKRWNAAQSSLRQLRRARQRHPERDEAAAGILEFFDWSFGCMKALESRLESLSHSAAQDHESIGRRIDDLLLQSKNLLMLPFSDLVEWLPKMVRDLARSQGKHAELVIQGDNVQIDRRLIDEMKDPLIHLLRNAVDHGVEMPDERRAAGKPEKATLQLHVRFASGDRIELAVSDDGRGIDPAATKEAAVRAGVIGADVATQLDEADAIDLIFRSRVSTSPIVTDLSGRGLGLAIVREQVEKLGGQVYAQSRRGQGANFRITLPQSLGALRGLFVRIGDASFVIPAMNVASVSRIPVARVRTVQGRETVERAGRVLPLVALGDVLQPRGYRGLEEAELLTVVFIEAGNEALAVAVDEVLDDEEILIKRLEPPLLRVCNIAGATVAASGKVLPVLNVADVIKSVRRTRVAEPARTASLRKQEPEARARILLAEDSITTRLLLKGILEASGYDVRTAVDGVEAFTALRSEAFDLLVSDIEMPRLNGFDLTARIRSDPVLHALPVVLVTALSRREDKERGIDVGANAYIVKGSFDQRELVNAVQRLLALGKRE